MKKRYRNGVEIKPSEFLKENQKKKAVAPKPISNPINDSIDEEDQDETLLD